MLWTIVWVVLVVATVVGAFFLGRQLWRQGVALAHEAGDHRTRQAPAETAEGGSREGDPVIRARPP